MFKKYILLISIVTVLYSCCVNKITSENRQNLVTTIYGEEPFLKNQIPPKKIFLPEFFENYGFIFPKEYEPFWGQRFTPTKEEIKFAEQKLKEKNDSLGIAVNYKKRFRQYIGNYHNGEKTIHINLISIKKSCLNKSEFSFLLDKQFLQISQNPNFDKIIQEQIKIERKTAHNNGYK